MTVLLLILWICGVVGLFAQAFGVALGRVSPGWLGAGLIGLAVLLGEHLP